MTTNTNNINTHEAAELLDNVASADFEAVRHILDRLNDPDNRERAAYALGLLFGMRAAAEAAGLTTD